MYFCTETSFLTTNTVQEQVIDRLVSRFNAFWEHEALPDGCILLAFSAGIDSVVLGQLLQHTQRPFALAHCNFQLRGTDSDQDAEWAGAWAAEHHVLFHETRFSTHAIAQQEGVSVQMAARKLRYAYLEKVWKTEGYAAVATAHHQDDVLETMLLNLSRGTGLRGLHGIFPYRNHLIRPLLCFDKSEIRQLARYWQLKWREDRSNARTYYDRNRIRHKVVPALRKLNPQLSRSTFRTAQRLRGAEQLLSRQMRYLQDRIFQTSADGVWLDEVVFHQHIPEKEARYLFLEEWLRPLGFSPETIQQVALADDLETGKQFRGSSHRLDRERHGWLLRVLQPRSDEVSSTLTEDTQIVRWQGRVFRIRQAEKAQSFRFQADRLQLDAECLRFPLTLRRWEDGERFAPLGMAGKHQLVADFLMHQKCTQAEKARTPVLVSATGEIVAVVGFRPAETCKVRTETRRIWEMWAEKS